MMATGWRSYRVTNLYIRMFNSHTHTHTHREHKNRFVGLSIHSTIHTGLQVQHELPEAHWWPTLLNSKSTTHPFQSFAFGLSKRAS